MKTEQFEYVSGPSSKCLNKVNFQTVTNNLVTLKQRFLRQLEKQQDTETRLSSEDA